MNYLQSYFTFPEYPLHTEEDFYYYYYYDYEFNYGYGYNVTFDDVPGLVFMANYPNVTFSGILCEKGMPLHSFKK